MKNNTKKIFLCAIFLIFFTSPLWMGADFEKLDVYPQSQSIDRSLWTWSEYEEISDESMINSEYCSIDSDLNGNVYVVWHDTDDTLLGSGSDIDIFMKRFYYVNQSWSDTELISDISTLDSVNPDVNVDILGNVHVSWVDYTPYGVAGTDGDVFYKKWDAQTQTWTSYDIISSLSSAHCYSPQIYCDNNSVIHAVWYEDFDNLGVERDVFYRAYNPDTYFWGPYQNVSEGCSDYSNAPKLNVDNQNNVHVVWYDYTNLYSSGDDTDILYRKKDSTLESWGDIEVISTVSSSSSRNPDIVVDDSNTIHVIWEDDEDEYQDAGTFSDIFYRQFDPTSQSWKSTEVVSKQSTSFSKESALSIDSEMDIHAIWLDGENLTVPDIDYDVVHATFNSKTQEWSEMSLISTESVGNIDRPDVVVDSFDFVHVIWEDPTNFPDVDPNTNIYYRQFSGLSISPTLDPIYPNPSATGIVNLGWRDLGGNVLYHLYRDTHSITSLNDLIPIASISTNSYQDVLSVNGSYFYVIVAENAVGNSSISNVEYIEVLISSEQPPDQSGFFGDISWGEILIFAAIAGAMQLVTVIILKGGKTKNKNRS